MSYWKKNNNILPEFLYAKSVIDYHAKSFSFASRFLPEDKKWATYAVYAFCRYTDNIIDNPRDRSEEELLEEIDELETELRLSEKYGESEHPAISAFVISSKEFNIPYKYAYDLIKGVKMDMYISSYETFDDLYVFCYRVASVVGLMMTYVLGFKGEDTLEYAEKLGIAMQLTNILRDIQEDKNSGRIYLPKEDLDKFGVSEIDINTENFNDNFRELMIFQIERANKYYMEAEPGIKKLDKESRFAIYAASRIYSGILPKIKEVDYNPFYGRVFVPSYKKVLALISEYFKRNL